MIGCILLLVGRTSSILHLPGWTTTLIGQHHTAAVGITMTPTSSVLLTVTHCSVLFLSRPRSEGWPHHGLTFSINPCPLSFWLTLPRRVLSTSWCCPSWPCVVFLACVHLALFLALSLSPGNSLVSSWCDHSMLASLLWLCLNSSLFTTGLLRTHSFVFCAVTHYLYRSAAVHSSVA